MFILNFQPGQVLPSHKHPGAKLFLLVLKGEGSFNINGNEIYVKKDDLITVTGDEELSFTNNGKENVSHYVTLHNTPSPEIAVDI
ncbi:cupin domain-containing protein [Bacillus andreraoultii]|uniref:cupin domain-containing protein n=1 Tax=Bacillus andreraoultii TaxID=1499685 RepID=UPI000A9A9C5A|nr:cupin domain-containing protein [Bacillus andreraoultii]